MVKIFKEKGEAILLFLVFFIFYLVFQTKSIYGGDSGDLVTAAWVWGIPHPPGYPLYSLIASLLVHLFSLKTPAWRVGLISSFSSALTLTVFFLLMKNIISKNSGAARCAPTVVSILGTLVLAFLYPFWLYSEVAEVFALNNLFVALLVYLFFRNGRTHGSAPTGLFFLILGLALAHHHTIVLLLPGFLYLIHKNKKLKTGAARCAPTMVLAVLLGLSFYIYPLLACRKTPLVCWDDPVNLPNLVRLVTRADYGTFRSTGSLGNEPILRLYSLLAGFKLALNDFSILGIMLIILGAVYGFRKYKDFTKFILITLTVCCFFIFYASYMLVNDFMVATFERFIILPYIFMTMLLVFGVLFILEKTQVLLIKFKVSNLSQKVFLNGLKIIFFILPFSLLMSNFKRISILKNDLTAENMAKDFLTPLPQNSVLIVSSDTTVFDLQYARYVLGVRKDVIVLSYPLMPAPYYQKMLKKQFPQLILFQEKDHQKNLEEFAKANLKNFAVFVDGQTFNPLEDWLPLGLAIQYLPQNQQAKANKTVEENLLAWSNYADPLQGSLSSFRNLFLTDILRVYQNAEIYFGQYLIDQNFLTEAENVFKKAMVLNPQNDEVFLGLGQVYLKAGKCQQAKDEFEKSLKITEQNALALGWLRKTELECFKNEGEAKKYENQCLSVTEKGKPSLENLGK